MAMLVFEQAETQLRAHLSSDCIDTATDALEQFEKLKDKRKVGEAARVLLRAQRQAAAQAFEKPSSAVEAAEEYMEKFSSAGNKHGQAAMLLALAELKLDFNSWSKREEAAQDAAKARSMYKKELADKRMEIDAACILIEIRFRQGNAVECQKEAEGILTRAKELGDDEVVARATQARASCHATKGDFGEAVATQAKAVRLFRDADNLSAVADANLLLAEWCIEAKEPKRAVAAAREAMKICQETGDGKGWEAQVLGKLITTLIAAQKPKEASQLAKKAAAKFGEDDATDCQAFATCLQATALTSLGAHAEAIEVGNAALNLAGEVDNGTFVAMAHHALSLAYRAKFDGKNGAKSLEAEIDALREKGYDVEAANAMRELSQVYAYMLRDSNKAIDVATQAKDLYGDSGEGCGEAFASLSLSQARLAIGDIPESRQRAQEAVDIFRDAGDSRNEAEALHAVSDLYLMEGDLIKAMGAAQEERRLFEEMDNKRMQGRAQTAFAELRLWDQPQDAVSAARAARELYEEANDVQGQVDALIIMVQGYLSLLAEESIPEGAPIREVSSTFVHAERAATEAVSLARSVGRFASAPALFWYANMATWSGKAADAIAAAKQALALFEKMGDRAAEGMTVLLLGQLNFWSGKKDIALSLANQANNMFKQIGDLHGQDSAGMLLEQLETGDLTRELEAIHKKYDPDYQGDEDAHVAKSFGEPQMSRGLNVNLVSKRVMEQVRNAIKNPKGELDLDSDLKDSGLDDAASKALRASLGKDYRMTFKQSVTVENPTARDLADHIVAQSRRLL